MARAGGMGGGRGRGRACASNSMFLWWRCLERGDVAYCNCGNCGGGNCGGTAASAASGSAALRDSSLDGAAATWSGTGPIMGAPCRVPSDGSATELLRARHIPRPACQTSLLKIGTKMERFGAVRLNANVTLPSGPCRIKFTAEHSLACIHMNSTLRNGGVLGRRRPWRRAPRAMEAQLGMNLSGAMTPPGLRTSPAGASAHETIATARAGRTAGLTRPK